MARTKHHRSTGKNPAEATALEKKEALKNNAQARASAGVQKAAMVPRKAIFKKVANDADAVPCSDKAKGLRVESNHGYRMMEAQAALNKEAEEEKKVRWREFYEKSSSPPTAGERQVLMRSRSTD